MKISLNSRITSNEISGINGYGYATKCMLKSLKELGYDIRENDTTADVGLVFDQPHHARYEDHQYKILYLPWESTLLHPEWVPILNSVDEVWTPSSLIADWYKRYNGIRTPVYVYEHGIEPSWFDYRATLPKDITRFLHIGAETRKNGWVTLNAFRQAFGPSPDVSFTFKTVGQGKWNKIPRLGRIQYVDEKMDLSKLQQFMSEHHVYSYLSSGEGFGLTPLQAMSMGMPTLTVAEWAPYRDFLHPDLCVDAKLAPTNWEKIHPGKMYRINFDDAIDKMRAVVDNYEMYYEHAQSQVAGIEQKYNWNSLTKDTFDSLISRLNNKR